MVPHRFPESDGQRQPGGCYRANGERRCGMPRTPSKRSAGFVRLTKGLSRTCSCLNLALRNPLAVGCWGRIAANTGSGTRGWPGHLVDQDCVAFGNGMVGEQVLTALVAGGQRCASGHLSERSAAIKVVSYPTTRTSTCASVSTKTRWSNSAACWEEFKRYETFYRGAAVSRGKPSRKTPSWLVWSGVDACNIAGWVRAA
jgi:uncharacterized Ntn-hydrolase superfamily protein